MKAVNTLAHNFDPRDTDVLTGLVPNTESDKTFWLGKNSIDTESLVYDSTPHAADDYADIMINDPRHVEIRLQTTILNCVTSSAKHYLLLVVGEDSYDIELKTTKALTTHLTSTDFVQTSTELIID